MCEGRSRQRTIGIIPLDYLVAEISFKKISCVGFANDQIISHNLWTFSTVADLQIEPMKVD